MSKFISPEQDLNLGLYRTYCHLNLQFNLFYIFGQIHPYFGQVQWLMFISVNFFGHVPTLRFVGVNFF